MSSIGSTLGTPVNHAGSNLPTITPPTKVPNVPKGPVALDTGRGVGLIEALNIMIQSGSAIGAFFKSISPQGSSQNEYTTSLLQQSGFVTKGLTQKQIQTLGDGLKKELMNGRLVQRAQTIQNSNQTMTRDQVGTVATRNAFKAIASGNGIPLQANNIVPFTEPQNESSPLCIARLKVMSGLPGKYSVQADGFARDKYGRVERAELTLTVTAEHQGKPLIAPGTSNGTGTVTVPESRHAYLNVPMRSGVEIEANLECLVDGQTTKGRDTFQAP